MENGICLKNHRSRQFRVRFVKEGKIILWQPKGKLFLLQRFH